MGHKQYFVVEEDRKSVHMTEHGAKAAQAHLGIGTFYDTKNMNWPHYIDNALRAHKVYQRDKEYVVQDDTIVIVDEFTGRLMQGRQWSDGLHQAVEAKERVTVKQETQTLATITLQNLFKLYRQIAGMTGTAMTEADEFMKIYKLEVIAIPTNRPVRRTDYNDKIYKTVANKFDAIVEEIRAYSHDGYPSDPWSLLDMLKHARRTLRELQQTHGGPTSGRSSGGDRPEVGPPGAAEVGPPRNAEVGPLGDDEQAELARQLAVIDETLAAFGNGEGDAATQALVNGYRKLMGTNVGGRPVLVGTVSVENSEKLSAALSHRYGIEHEVLNAKNHAREAEIVAKAGQQHETTRGKKKLLVGNVTIATNMAGRGTDIVLGPGVPALGGLHVVGTERHESRRIDNQLRGRCGRQGDPGSSRFFLSFEDDLLRLFMGEWVLRMLNMLGFEEGMAIEDKRVNKGIERGAEEGRGAELSHPQELAGIRRGNGLPAQDLLQHAPAGRRGPRPERDDLGDDRCVGWRRHRPLLRPALPGHLRLRVDGAELRRGGGGRQARRCAVRHARPAGARSGELRVAANHPAHVWGVRGRGRGPGRMGHPRAGEPGRRSTG